MKESLPPPEPAEKSKANKETAVALAALIAASPALAEKVHAAEISPTATWEEGLEDLHHSALTENIERGGYFSLKDGQASWHAMSESTIDAAHRVVIEHDTKAVEELIAEGVDEVRHVHTHPLAIIKDLPGAENVPADTPPEHYSQPPSFSDLLHAIELHYQFEDAHNIAHQSIMVDPQGVWKIEIDGEHRVPSWINEYVETQRALESGLRERIPNISDEELKETIRSLVYMTTEADAEARYGADIAMLKIKLFSVTGSLESGSSLHMYDMLTSKYLEKATKDPAEARQRIIEFAEPNGIDITFTPHEAQEPLRASVEN